MTDTINLTSIVMANELADNPYFRTALAIWVDGLYETVQGKAGGDITKVHEALIENIKKALHTINVIRLQTPWPGFEFSGQEKPPTQEGLNGNRSMDPN